MGLEVGVDRDMPYDPTQTVAFPPMWIKSGAKVARDYEPEANWKDRMQDWETPEEPKPNVYTIAIEARWKILDNIVAIYNN
jgi:hypothetical protein